MDFLIIKNNYSGGVNRKNICCVSQDQNHNIEKQQQQQQQQKTNKTTKQRQQQQQETIQIGCVFWNDHQKFLHFWNRNIQKFSQQESAAVGHAVVYAILCWIYDSKKLLL